MNIRYRVTLTAEERQQLKELVHGGVGGVRKIKRAQILLAADGGCKDEAIAQTIGVGTSTVYRTKQRFVEDGLERALHESPRPGAPRKLSAADESLLIAVTCSDPPEGRAEPAPFSWTPSIPLPS
jgi:transposase